ncbi:MAG: hypothetical protein Q8R30_03470 [bacterium]|nr:hypothetical protein [bacterium]MDZ4260627.1 hypothetical protein [Candidatus Sungbacteria bacterium]
MIARIIVIIILLGIAVFVILPFTLFWFGVNLFPQGGVSVTPQGQQSNVSKVAEDLGILIRSEDGGVTWHNAARSENPTIVFPSHVYALVNHPKDPDVMYVTGTGAGLWKSVNRGLTWNKMIDAGGVLIPEADVYDVELLGPNGDVMYVGVYEKTHGRILRSDDGGAHFTEVYVTSKERTPVYDVVIDPADKKHVLAVTGEGTVIETKNSGATWRIKKIFAKPIMRLIGNPRNVSELYAINADGEVLKSVTGGSDWSDPLGTPQGERPPLEHYPPTLYDLFGSPPKGLDTVFMLDPNNASRAYLAFQKSLLRSSDAGLTWKEVNLLFNKDILPVRALAIDPHKSSIMFIAASKELNKSTDGGETWSNIPLPAGVGMKRLMINSHDSNLMFAVIGK